MPSHVDPAETEVAALLHALGMDADPEMADTPRHFAAFLRSLDPDRPAPPMEILASTSTDPVVLRSIPFYSLCAHHLVPFFGEATVAYRPGGAIVGLGNLVRRLRYHALRPQLQERLGAGLADDLLGALGARSVLVRLQARHLCLEMRGASTSAQVVTAAWRGESDPLLQALALGNEEMPLSSPSHPIV